MDGWDKWGNHVLVELKRVNSNIVSLNETVAEDRVAVWSSISKLQVKAGLWGLVGGGLAVIPTLVFFYMKS